jgi:DNA (cytosine-5)-methyltransferase 1
MYNPVRDGDDYRVCNVAIDPDADWRTLPEELAIGPNSRKQRDVRYSRIDGSGFFRTAVTTVAPSSQGSTVLHPTVRHSLFLSRLAAAKN